MYAEISQDMGHFFKNQSKKLIYFVLMFLCSSQNVHRSPPFTDINIHSNTYYSFPILECNLDQSKPPIVCNQYGVEKKNYLCLFSF